MNDHTLEARPRIIIATLIWHVPLHDYFDPNELLRVLSSLARLPGSFQVDHPSKDYSKSNNLNCGVLMKWATQKKMYLIDVSGVLKMREEERGDERVKHVEILNRERPCVAFLLAKLSVCDARTDRARL
ncbi:hypothetical protein MTR_8g072270 [Medicago truncatula]|uniref:Uncharacterized protein n=1 Tax=Medicago truncatula TaxID=3880 RepID=G7L7U4_MEDTR|nr:hypothetical protein MTR_8g072270 [Medicago truncatula]